MPRGKFVNHKGRNRHFTNPEELEEQRRQEEEKRKWRKNKNEETSSEEEEEEEDAKAASRKKDDNSESGSEDSESESDSDAEGKAKGVENLIQVENPNRVQKKAKKLSQLNEALANSSKPELSRREREQLEKQKAMANYQKLHAAGKTDEARADLARLAIIKQQREEAAKKREQDKKAKEMAAQKQKEMTQKALGKRA